MQLAFVVNFVECNAQEEVGIEFPTVSTQLCSSFLSLTLCDRFGQSQAPSPMADRILQDRNHIHHRQACPRHGECGEPHTNNCNFFPGQIAAGIHPLRGTWSYECPCGLRRSLMRPTQPFRAIGTKIASYIAFLPASNCCSPIFSSVKKRWNA